MSCVTTTLVTLSSRFSFRISSLMTSFLYDRDEFVTQIEMHRDLMGLLKCGYRPVPRGQDGPSVLQRVLTWGIAEDFVLFEAFGLDGTCHYHRCSDVG